MIMCIDNYLNCDDACIYCLLFPNGKRYIGKTKCLRKRIGLYKRFGGSGCVNDAIVEFGWDSIDFRILSVVSCVDVVDLELCLSILELKYIREYDTTDVDKGYNISFGGECLGIPIECITTNSESIRRFSNGVKVVLCYDLDGNFVKEYDSIGKCAYDNGVDDEAIRCCLGKNKVFADKWYLRVKRYDYIPMSIEVSKYEIRERVRYKDVIEERVVVKDKVVHTYTPALRYDMNGKFCGEYRSKRDACKSFLRNTTCGWGVYKNGYILFKKTTDDYPKEIEPYVVLCRKQLKEYYVKADVLPDLDVFSDDVKGKKGDSVVHLCVDGKYTNIKHVFKVYQYKKSGELVSEYDSIRDASHATGIPYPQIYNCLRGATKTAHGFIWKKAEE